jgi:hypothetical protein
VPTWTSQTQQFPPGELSMLEQMEPDELAIALANSDPLVILRALAEVKLNGDTDKLDALLRNSVINALWPVYDMDRDVNDHDHGYAAELRDYAAQR